MHPEGLTVLLLNFAAIGALPLVFFKRDGSFNAMWWLTACPFYISSASIITSYAGKLAVLPGLGQPFIEALSMILSVVSIGLIAMTLGTHRIPIALWHQGNDAPQHIVTWGAYRHVRHPFYASFLIALTAAVLYCPQVFTIGALLYGLAVMNLTAEREERRLAASEFGEEYRNYMQRTGRFLPRWGN